MHVFEERKKPTWKDAPQEKKTVVKFERAGVILYFTSVGQNHLLNLFNSLDTGIDKDDIKKISEDIYSLELKDWIFQVENGCSFENTKNKQNFKLRFHDLIKVEAIDVDQRNIWENESFNQSVVSRKIAEVLEVK